MEQTSEHHPTQPRRKPLLSRSGRAIHCVAFSILWSTSYLVLLHNYSACNGWMVWRRNDLQLLYGCSNPERLLFHRGSSCKSTLLSIMMIAKPGKGGLMFIQDMFFFHEHP